MGVVSIKILWFLAQILLSITWKDVYIHNPLFVLISCCEYKSEKRDWKKVNISFKWYLSVVIFLMEKIPILNGTCHNENLSRIFWILQWFFYTKTEEVQARNSCFCWGGGVLQ